ncbi:MAG: Gfo/Idh/MocA family oxidoreductase [Clostridia bacterium]|nr:Gfo/Idh/MocA family oxidoreductase [Clostridia bacterium]
MKKIAILGCENSHADSFLKFIKHKEEFNDIEVVGVYSDDLPAAEKLREKFGVPVLGDYADAVGKIDGLIITARHGDNHYKYAKPYIKSGIPMFIDKPITVKEEEAVAFMRELRENGVPFCGGSSLKQDAFVMKLKEEAQNETNGKTIGGIVRAPYSSENAYGGFYFYSQHLVEMICEIFGRFPLSVTAKQNGKQIHVLFHYADYDCVGVYTDGNYLYYAARMAEKATTGFEIPSSGDWFYREFKEFYELLHGAPRGITHEEFISPVFIMNAIERSLASGKEETIGYTAV